jgi:dethiobiotin synthetase
MDKNKNIFITSTGTNIGKTYCTVEILKEMLHRKVLFNAYKPILSGFDIYNIKDSDSYKILKTKNKEPEIEDIKEITPWLFEKPLAPSIAAKKESKRLKYNDVLEWCLKKSNNNIINIFEGAGGVLVPIEKIKTLLDLMKDLNSKVVLVIGNYLGSVSHTLSAIQNLQHANLQIINIIINENINNNDIDIKDTESLLRSSIKRKIIIRKVNYGDKYSSISIKKITEDIISSC